MKKVTFTLANDKPLTLFVGAGNLAVTLNGSYTRISDGVHNNGGWDVQESYDEVIARLSIALGDFT
jgi:hypothetical protein